MSDDTAISPRNQVPPDQHLDAAVKSEPASVTTTPFHFAQPHHLQGNSVPEQPSLIHQPPARPFSETDNTDAMALRAAISVLQMQRDKSKRDLQILEKLKHAAISQPEAFAAELAAGRLRQDANPSDPLQATFESDSDEDDEVDGESQAPEKEAKFPKFPNMQNVFRAPHVNWARYNIVGEPLDRMHEEQRLRPGQGEKLKDDVPEFVIAAPYSPFRDKLTDQPAQPTTSRRASTKP